MWALCTLNQYRLAILDMPVKRSRDCLRPALMILSILRR
jgi:hypothetical protein